MKKIKILLTCAGSINSINIWECLKNINGYSFQYVCVDTNYLNASKLFADKFIYGIDANDADYIDKIIDIYKRNHIDIWLPTHSKELSVISSQYERLNFMKIKVLVNKPNVLKITNDKISLSDWLSKHNFYTPRIFYINEKLFPPLFIKRIAGTGSRDAKIVRQINEIGNIDRKDFMIQEYIEGKEYTTDIYITRSGRLIGTSIRERLETRGGAMTKGIIVKDEGIEEEVKRLSQELGLIGGCNIQCIKKANKLYFTDVNPRLASGGLVLSARAGLNIPLLIIKDLLGEPIKPLKIKYGLAGVRYYQTASFMKEKP